MVEMAWETNTEDSGASTEGSRHHQPVPNQYKRGGPTVKGIHRAWFGGGGKGGLYLVSCHNFFWNMPYCRNKWLGPFDACHRVK